MWINLFFFLNSFVSAAYIRIQITTMAASYSESRSAKRLLGGAELSAIWMESGLLNYRGFVGQQRGKHRRQCAKYWSLLSLHCGAHYNARVPLRLPHTSLWKSSLIFTLSCFFFFSWSFWNGGRTPVSIVLRVRVLEEPLLLISTGNLYLIRGTLKEGPRSN